jgi:prophage regulatory protein
MTKLFLDLKEVADTTTLGEATVQRLVREHAFPQPRQISGKRVGWLFREVQEWCETRPVSNQLPPPNTSRRAPKQPATGL